MRVSLMTNLSIGDVYICVLDDGRTLQIRTQAATVLHSIEYEGVARLSKTEQLQLLVKAADKADYSILSKEVLEEILSTHLESL